MLVKGRLHLNAALTKANLHAKGQRWLHDSSDEKVLIMASSVGLPYRPKQPGTVRTVGVAVESRAHLMPTKRWAADCDGHGIHLLQGACGCSELWQRLGGDRHALGRNVACGGG
jgi:hypothetical protein